MTKLVFIERNGKRYDVDATDGMSVMRAAINNGVRGILGDCGGACSCATCHGYIDLDWAARIPPASDEERAMLECAIDETPHSRLTCQITVTPALEGLVIRLPASQV